MIDASIEFTVEIPEVQGWESTFLAGSVLESCASNVSNSPSLFPPFSVTAADILKDLCAHEPNVMIVLHSHAGKSERSRSWLTSMFGGCPGKEDMSAKTSGETGDHCAVDVE